MLDAHYLHLLQVSDLSATA